MVIWPITLVSLVPMTSALVQRLYVWSFRTYQNLEQIDPNLHNHAFDDVICKPPIRVIHKISVMIWSMWFTTVVYLSYRRRNFSFRNEFFVTILRLLMNFVPSVRVRILNLLLMITDLSESKLFSSQAEIHYFFALGTNPPVWLKYFFVTDIIEIARKSYCSVS